jgi:NAD(P)-dependent dehydrogenase (short-subunit alcohol dehydrogenase family)
MQLKGETIIVFGAAGGIGSNIVDVLLEDGAQVIATDLESPASNAHLNRICDVRDQDQIDDTVSQVERDFGPVCGSVFVAGVLHPATPTEELRVEDWERVHDTNVVGALRVAKAVVPLMKERRYGRIVHIASWWGYYGHAYFAPYGSSKSALMSLTQSMAEELGPTGVTVNSVSPGMIDTPMHRNAIETEAAERDLSFEEMQAIEWAKIPLGYAGPPSAISDAVSFLLSRRSGYITGATIDVNGGVLFR